MAAPAEETKPANKVEPTEIDRLVEQLGSDQYSEREEATLALNKMGTVALGRLRKATRNSDPEVSRRASELVRQIERRDELARLLLPRRIRLVYADMPVTEAIDDLARLTGFQVQLEGDRSKAEKRKITLDTGEVTFWEAIEQFCQKAELAETESMLLPEAQGLTVDLDRMERMRWRAWGWQPYYPNQNQEFPLIFKDGASKPLPSCFSGAVRIRAVPMPAPKEGVPKVDPEKEVPLVLEIKPEPHLGWDRVLSVRIGKIVDDQDREMLRPAPFIEKDSDGDDFNPYGYYPARYRGNGNTTVTLGKNVFFRLPHPPERVKSFRTVQGTIIAEILTRPQPLMVMEDILHSAGKSVSGTDSGSLRVEEVSRSRNGEVKLRVIIEPPSTDHDDAMFGRARFNRGVIWAGQSPDDSTGIGQQLTLMDGKGRGFKLTQSTPTQLENGCAQQYDLTFEPPSGLPAPVKLVYSGQRLAVVDVPFTLHDVSLP
jgi:hypothetical protein